MCKREIMRVVSRFGVFAGFSGGSVLGLIRVLMLMCKREWGVPVRIITMGTASTCVLGQFEQSAFAREVFFSMVRWWVSLRLLYAQYFHSPI
jgi:hypothetical protein